LNDPPVLRLTGPAGTADGKFAAVLLESQRTTSVAIADSKLLLLDVDNDLLAGLTVSIQGRRDGVAEARLGRPGHARARSADSGSCVAFRAAAADAGV
jgi:hypothetical protein